MSLSISPEQVEGAYQVLQRIGCLGADPSAGFLRAAYSDQESAAMRHIESLAMKAGARARWDAVGNLALEWPGTEPNYVEAASHIDTVPRGGNYDGAAGVVAGLLALSAVHATATHRKGLRLRIWRGEESGTFNVLYAGSRAAFGILSEEYLGFRFQERSLELAMRSQGADPEAVRAQRRTVSQEEVDLIDAHFELHIEQGNLLEVARKDVGIVTSIRSSKRYRVQLRGQFDHSGATPMGTAYRKDVNLGMAYIQVALDGLCTAARAGGADLVQTVGVINSNYDFNQAHPEVYTNAIPVISGYGYFTYEVRSNRKITLESYSAQAEQLIQAKASEFGLTTEISLLTSGTPLEALDPQLQDLLQLQAEKQQISFIRLASGAGHDAAIVGAQKRSDASSIPVAMLFIPCKAGKSHCPEEYTSYDAIAKGASVLAGALQTLAR